MRTPVARFRPGGRASLRRHLALVYGLVFLGSGAVLLLVTFGLFRGFGSKSVSTTTVTAGPGKGPVTIVRRAGDGTLSTPPTHLPLVPVHVSGFGQASGNLPTGAGGTRQAVVIARLQGTQHAADLHSLVEVSAIALVVMAVASVGLGWLLAGRLLDPLRTITAAARRVSASNLHERLAFAGPNDELRQLADTFDDLLGRLEASFEAQRRFVANASHELRTPLARQRALAEVALSDPEPTVEGLLGTVDRLLTAGVQQERLTEALLTLARSERGLDRREPIDLAEVVTTSRAAPRAGAGEQDLRWNEHLAPALVAGDRALLERLVANLVDNALSHNLPGGHVEVTTATHTNEAVLRVSNSGRPVNPAQVTRLLEPFQRLGSPRTGANHGLGLSIVQAIATAHGAGLAVAARADGGLEVEIRFPPVPSDCLPGGALDPDPGFPAGDLGMGTSPEPRGRSRWRRSRSLPVRGGGGG